MPDKTDAMKAALDDIYEPAFGIKPSVAIETNICVYCKQEAKEFRDDLSRREFSISGLCQKCQDNFINYQEED